MIDDTAMWSRRYLLLGAGGSSQGVVTHVVFAVLGAVGLVADRSRESSIGSPA